jgi:CubicO group peptidase (beta-lactamase class C family)
MRAPSGSCDPRFARVRDAFTENFTLHGDVGAAVCVTVDGAPVVDLWGGWSDGARTRPWQRDTIVSVASTTKGMTAIAALRLVERGRLGLDAPVARYWPEFAQAGKAELPVRWLLSHRAGLPAVRRDLAPGALYDWTAFCEALAESEPWWPPGTRHGYHALTYGYLVGEVVRRVSGTTLGRRFASDVAGPLDADFFIGVPDSEDHRAAEVLPDPPAEPGEVTLWDVIARDPTSIAYRAFFNPPHGSIDANSPAWRRAEVPAANGHTTARALARIYGALACGGAIDGVRVLEPGTIRAATTEQSSGPDAVLPMPTRFGLGFMLTQPGGDRRMLAFPPLGPNPGAFGHPGRGGSIGFADPDARVGFGYVTNQYLSSTFRRPDVRWPRLAAAVYESLAR